MGKGWFSLAHKHKHNRSRRTNPLIRLMLFSLAHKHKQYSFFLCLCLCESENSLKVLANEDTLLRTHCCRHTCFPVCPRAQHLLRIQILCPGHKNVSDFVQKHFVSATNVSQFARARKRHEQQCFRNNVSSFASTLRRISGFVLLLMLMLCLCLCRGCSPHLLMLLVCLCLCAETLSYKLRHYLTFPQMKQIYYSLIYPYISYAILAWGSAYKTHINKIQIKQNHSARLIFFATDHGEHTESALSLLNLLDVLTIHNVYRFHILKFTYLWHKGLLPKPFSNYLQYASNVHKYNTRYASKQNLYLKKVRTNMGKQAIGYAARVIWDEIPLKLKELSVYQFSKQLKPYLLSEQHN